VVGVSRSWGGVSVGCIASCGEISRPVLIVRGPTGRIRSDWVNGGDSARVGRWGRWGRWGRLGEGVQRFLLEVEIDYGMKI